MVVMNADGSNKHVLFKRKLINEITAPLWGRQARWSPSGTKVAYDLCANCAISTNSDIYIFDTATKAITRLTKNPANDLYPAWSPDGSSIAFISNRAYINADSARYRTGLYVINADDSRLQDLTKKSGTVGTIAWNPKSSGISFITQKGLYEYDFVADTVLDLPIDFKYSNYKYPRPISWSKDGKYLLLEVPKKYPKTSFSLYNTLKKRVQKISLSARQIEGSDYFAK
jgi:Tol biopolymer transport system component